MCALNLILLYSIILFLLFYLDNLLKDETIDIVKFYKEIYI